MRLREILNIINENYNNLSKLSLAQRHDGYITIGNLQIVKKSLLNIQEIEVFSKRANSILGSQFVDIIDDRISVQKHIADPLKLRIQEFEKELLTLKRILDNLLNEQDELTLSIKLYEFENFKEFSDFCNSFNKKILEPLRRINEEVKVGEFEIGSRWINIIVGTTLGVQLLTYTFHSAFDILIHDYQKFKIVQNMVSAYEEQNERLNDFNDFLEAEKSKLFYEKSEDIFNLLKENDDFSLEKEEEINEFKNSIKISLEESYKLIDKGLELYQALDVPSEKRYELPNYKELIPYKKDTKYLSVNKE